MNPTLAVYWSEHYALSVTGVHKHSEQLSYPPQEYHGVTYTDTGHIIVGQYHPPQLHVHNPVTGQYISTVTTADLGLTSDDRLLAVQCSTDGMLHLYVRDGRYAGILHTYKVLTHW